MAEVAQLTVEVRQRGTKEATSSLNDLSAAAGKAEKSTTALNTATNKSRASDFGRKAGMAGIQIEQMSGQIALGVNPMRAMGVQAADLGFVLGAPLLGAVVGIGAAFASVLMPSAGRAKSAIEELESATEILDGTFKRTSASTQTLSDDIITMSQRSESLALLKLAQNAMQVEAAITSAGKAIGDELFHTLSSNKSVSVNFSKDLAKSGISAQGLASNVYSVSDALDGLGVGGTKKLMDLRGTVSRLSRTLGVSREDAIEFAVAVSNFKTDKSVDNMNALALVAASLGQRVSGSGRESFINFGVAIADISSKAMDAEAKLKLIQDATSDLTGFLDRNSQATGDSITAIGQLVSILDGEEKALKTAKDQTISLAAAKIYLSAINAGESEDAARALAARYASIEAQKEEMRTTKTATKDKGASLKTLASLSDKAFNQEEQYRRSYGRRIDELRIQRDADITNATAYNEAILGLEAERDQRISQYRDNQINMERNAAIASMDSLDMYMSGVRGSMANLDEALRDVAAGALQTFQYSVGNAFEQFAMGEITATEALQGITKAILGGIINAIGQMAAQYIISQFAIESFMRGSAIAAAQGQGLQASAMSLQAGLNAFASTAAIPVVGPALAPAAMSGAVAATSPIAHSITALAMSGALMGGRALGGQVLGGESYIVGERGPELLTMGGNGRITTNESLMGGSQGAPQVSNTNVSFSITANDTRGFDDLLKARRGSIVSMINKALADKGKRALV
jgi:hypothetical protein